MRTKRQSILLFTPGRLLYLSCFLLMTLASYGQSITVSGTVTSSTGETLPMVNILIKGTPNGTSTDLDGKYQLAANVGDVLTFSYVGFVTMEKTITSATLNVVLTDNAQQLGEVVVIGYGTTTVKDATGSLTAVSAKDFNKGNIVTPENLLNGRVAGLSINSGGEPGAGATIRIRGGASLGASNDPLIVINGLPIDNGSVGGSRSILSTLNPNEIQSFTVLKDASATAIYGSRASNGVIIITTKEGSSDFRVNLDIQGSTSSLVKQFDVFTADEFREVVAEKRPDLVPLLGDANTNWQDEIYRTGVSSNLNLSVQGSVLDKIPTRLAIGRTSQEGIRLTSKFERNSVNLNLSPRLFDNHLRISVSANGAQENNRFASGQEGNAITFDPTQPVYDPESPFGGFFQYYDLNDDGVLNVNDLTPNAPSNPVAQLLQRNSTSQVQRIFGNAKFDYNLHFLPDMNAVVNLGFDEQVGEGSTFVSDESTTTQPNGEFLGSQSNYRNYRRNVLFDSYLAYNKDLSAFNIDATAGYSFQKFESSSYTSGELLNDQVDSEPRYTQSTDIVLIGYFGRANISYNEKYFLTLSFRRDGTSRFGPSTRWGNFPAAAFAWKLKEEFFSTSNTLSSLKFRAGWGVVGQQNIGQTDLFLERYVTGQPASQYRFGNQIIPVGLPQFRNENLKWEETSKYNAGFDFGFLDDRFTGTLEGFYQESRDLLSNAAISDGSNFSNAGYQNIGNFSSKGIEFTINANLFENREGFSWDVNYNATWLRTEIKNLALNADQLVGGIGGGVGNTIQIHRVGFAPYTFYVYNQIYDENGNPIEGAFSDLNGDNIINNEDRYLYKTGAPDATMGFLSNMSYKKFTLSFNLRASIGNYVYNNVNSSRAQYDLLENNAVVSNLPSSVKASGFNTTADVILSDYFMENASFIKMDNVTLGYSFNDVLGKSSVMRVSAGVQNVFTITNYSGLDPEVFGNGIDNTIYPRARTIFLGVNVTF